MRTRVACLLFIVVLICMLLLGCDYQRYQSSFTYEFYQDRSNVEKVEICAYEDKYPVGEIMPLVQLSEMQIDSFLDDILGLECRETKKFDTPRGYGDLIFVVSYINGEKEIFGFVNLGRIMLDGSNKESLQYFDPIELCKLFAKYGSPDVLSEASEDFKHWYSKINE